VKPEGGSVMVCVCVCEGGRREERLLLFYLRKMWLLQHQQRGQAARLSELMGLAVNTVYAQRV
jgi:hypothetical protein